MCRLQQPYIIDVDFSGMGQAAGKNANPVDLTEVHLAFLRCPSDLFKVDGDSIQPWDKNWDLLNRL